MRPASWRTLIINSLIGEILLRLMNTIICMEKSDYLLFVYYILREINTIKMFLFKCTRT